MSVNRRLVRAIVDKELREFRRNRYLVFGMAIIPVVFSIQPLITVFALSSSESAPLRHEHVLLYMLGIPALVPSLVAAYSVVGEREQGTLEPLLITPIRREVFVPSVAVAFGVYGLFLACVEFFAQPSVAAALIRPSDLLAQLLFTPLLAGWSIWIAIVISTRANDVRVAQQLATLASLPSVALTTLIALNAIDASLTTAVVAAAALLLLNRIGWRVASAVFDRERLITGTK